MATGGELVFLESHIFRLLITLTLCVLSFVSFTNATPVLVEKAMTSGNTKWTSSFDLDVKPNEVLVSIDISLLPSKGVSGLKLKDKLVLWKEAINQKWNDQFIVSIKGKTKPIRFKVRFTHHNPHHRVVVHPDNWGPNQHNWYLSMPAYVAAHELGHMLGAYDEYKGGALSPASKIVDYSSIMGGNPVKGKAAIRHLVVLEKVLMEEIGTDKVNISNAL